MKFTREGIRVIIVTLLFSFAALNTGNNLMYLILATMISVLFLSSIVTYLNLRGIELLIEPEDELFVAQPARVNITIKNRKAFIPSYSILVDIKDLGNFYMPYVPSRNSITVKEFILPKKRGILRLKERAKLTTGFPFIFTQRTLSPDSDRSFVVYPELKDIDLANILADEIGHENPIAASDEFHNIREYRHGDESRLIHWKATAKTGVLMVKEFMLSETSKFTIVLDNFSPPNTMSFERSVSFAASIASKLISVGVYVRMVTCKKIIPFGTGKEHLFKILDILAIIEPADSAECPIEEEPGDGILILQSDSSPFKKFQTSIHTVVYASNL